MKSGSGVDIIEDSDGQGYITYSDASNSLTTFSGGKQTGPNSYLSAEKKLNYSFVGDLSLGGTLVIQGLGLSLQINRFHNNQLGIWLNPTDFYSPPAAPAGYTYLTDTHVGNSGNDWMEIPTLNPGLIVSAYGGDDTIIGNAVGSFLIGEDGNDILAGWGRQRHHLWRCR